MTQKYSSLSQKGFSLVEVIVAAFVFSIIVLVISGLFVQVLKNQRRAFALQKVEENGQYILELMAREIRVSTIQDQNSDCSATTLSMTHPVNGAIAYTVQSGVLQRTAGGVTGDLSSSDIQFSRLNFCIQGSGTTDDQAPRITIIAGIQAKNDSNNPIINLETTVSSRDVQSEL